MASSTTMRWILATLVASLSLGPCYGQLVPPLTAIYPEVPALAWLPIKTKVNSTFADPTLDWAGPAMRCGHSMVQIPLALAKTLVPYLDIGDGLGVQEIDDNRPSVAFMFGGVDLHGAALGDSWLLRVTSNKFTATADWIPVPTPDTATPLPARLGFSLEFMPASGRLVAFGGSDGGAYLNDAWEYVLSTSSPGWTQIALSDTGIEANPSTRANNGGWIRISSNTDALERLLMFGGATVTASGRVFLEDLWQFNTNTSTSSWSKPEGTTCLTTEEICPDAQSFGTYFPDVATYTDQITANYVGAAALRPSDVNASLTTLGQLSAGLTSALSTSNVTDYVPDADGACYTKCDAEDLSSIDTANRPAAREGHRISYFNWTNPETGVSYNQLILFGGTICLDGTFGESCYDPDLYFLDLDTFTWSVVHRPTQPPATVLDAWPRRRAFHTQNLYTVNSTAQLWVWGGEFFDGTDDIQVFRDDMSAYDLVKRRWYLQTLDLLDHSRLDSYGNRWIPHVPASQVASFLTSNQLWMHGGCSNANIDGYTVSPNPDDERKVWVVKLGQHLTADMWRVDNDDPIQRFGQGATTALPLLSDPTIDRTNYFFIECAEPIGYVKTWTDNSPYGVINANLANVMPKTNSTPVPYWGPKIYWSDGMALDLGKRLAVRMATTRVVSALNTNATALDPIVLIDATIAETTNTAGDVTAVYLVEYEISVGSTYQIYVTFDGIPVAGSPYTLKIETGLVSPLLTHAADISVPIPALIPVDPITGDLQQRYGNQALSDPMANPGHGLVKALRKDTASFLLQIVDIYENNWIDNTNAVYYTDSTVNSAVPFDAIMIDLYLLDSRGIFIRKMDNATEFKYCNNENGTYSVAYRVPDLPAFMLRININGVTINYGNSYPIIGITPLVLDDAQSSSMISILVILATCMVLCVIYFYLHRASPIMQSRSLLFDGLFALGTFFAMLAVIEQSSYSGGVHKNAADRLEIGTHNSCQLYNVWIGLAILLCFGSVYAQVRRAHFIFKSIRASALVRDEPTKKTIVLNQDLPNAPRHAPIPIIPNVQSDFHILLPVIMCIVAELVFQTIWIGVAPLRPDLQIAADGYRTYMICDGNHRNSWVYASIGIKAVMCLFFLYFITSGRKISDPISEPRMLSFVGYNLTIAIVAGTLIVLYLDSKDSIKTAFIISAIATFWGCIMHLALVFGPRIRQIARKKADQFWYDSFIIQCQEDELLAKAREEREAKGAFQQTSQSQLSTNGSQLGSPVAAITSPSNTVQLQRGGSSGSLKALKVGGAASATAVKPATGVSRAMPKTANPGTLRPASGSPPFTSTAATTPPAPLAQQQAATPEPLNTSL